MKKRGMAVLLVMAMMISTLIAAIPMTEAKAETYPLWVGGTQVTYENKGNIPATGNTINNTGTASYDPATNTLTLNNYKYEGPGYAYSQESYAAIYYYPGDGQEDQLTIDLTGKSSANTLAAKS